MEIVGRLRPYWAWLTSAALMAGALAIVFATGPDAGSVQARPGQFVAGRIDDDADVDTGTLRFPLGSLTIRVTAPITSPGHDEGLDGRTPPEDGSFLGVESRFLPATPYRVVGTSTVARAAPVLALVVVADGRRYPVRQIDEQAPTSSFPVGGTTVGYLGVTGRPDDVRVEATLDGVRQTVRPSTGAREVGPAKGLYRDVAAYKPGDQACGRATVTAGYRGADDQDDLPECRLTGHVRTPYVDGLGWAAAGHTWQLVDLDVGRSLRVDRVATGRPVQTYFSVYRDDDLEVRIDGRPSAGSPRVNAGSDSGYERSARAVVQVALDAPPVTVRIVSTFHRLRNRSNDADPTAPVGPDVSLTWTETLS